MVATRSTAKANEKPPLWKVLLLASRPNTLARRFTPVLVSHCITRHLLGSAADANKSFRFWVFACLIQIGTNLHNDYADFIKGADSENRIGQARATKRRLTPRQTAGLATLSLGLAHGIGVQLAASRGVDVVCYMDVVFNAVAYTGGPYPLGYVGLGWVSLGYTGGGDVRFAYFGMVAVAPYYLSGGTGAPSQLMVAAVCLGFLATAIILVNNLRDRDTDARCCKQTLAVRFGEMFAVREYVNLVRWAHILTFLSPFLFGAPYAWAAVPILPSKAAVGCCLGIMEEVGAALNPYVGRTPNSSSSSGSARVVRRLARGAGRFFFG